MREASRVSKSLIASFTCCFCCSMASMRAANCCWRGRGGRMTLKFLIVFSPTVFCAMPVAALSAMLFTFSQSTQKQRYFVDKTFCLGLIKAICRWKQKGILVSTVTGMPYDPVTVYNKSPNLAFLLSLRLL